MGSMFIPFLWVYSHAVLDWFELVVSIGIFCKLTLVHLCPHALISLFVALIVDFFLILLSNLLANACFLNICIVFVYEAYTVALIRIEVIISTPLQVLNIFCDALTLILSRHSLVVALLCVIFYLVFVEWTHLEFVLGCFCYVGLVFPLMVQLILQGQHIPHADFIAFLKSRWHMWVTFLNGGFKS